jgi:hypothetical protein
MKLTTREKQAISRIETMAQNGFSVDKIKRKLEPRYSSTESKKSLEQYLFNNIKK